MMKKLMKKLIFHSPKSRCKLIKLSSFSAVKDKIYVTRYVKNLSSASFKACSIAVITFVARLFLHNSRFEFQSLLHSFKIIIYLYMSFDFYPIFIIIHFFMKTLFYKNIINHLELYKVIKFLLVLFAFRSFRVR